MYEDLKQEVETLCIQAARDPQDVTIIAVSKTVSSERILPVYHAGCRNFGENKIQDVLPKMDALPSDILWHFIGTLQKNKINKVLHPFTLLHSIDTPSLAKELSERASREDVCVNILLQVNTSGEASKHGLPPELWEKEFLTTLTLPNIHIRGLMTLAPLTDNTQLIRNSFRTLRHMRDLLHTHSPNLTYLSMGMSHDYPIAIQEGSTHLRIGTKIFGQR